MCIIARAYVRKEEGIFSKTAEGFSPVFLRKVMVKIHQHLRTAWKIIDNYRLHYAFKQACKILNQTFKTTGVQGKNCEEHQFSDQSTLAMKKSALCS